MATHTSFVTLHHTCSSALGLSTVFMCLAPEIDFCLPLFIEYVLEQACSTLTAEAILVCLVGFFKFSIGYMYHQGEAEIEQERK